MKAAVIVIGNEILTGKFADANGPFFIRRLRELGVPLVRLVTIDDDLDAIADEVRRCSTLADVVFTTGGVGPTHDDLTFEGVARAFGVELTVHSGLVRVLEGFGLPADEANLRMCTLPAGSVLLDHPEVRFPTVRVKNVYVLPGIPKLVVSKFEAIAPTLTGTPVHTARLYCDAYESQIAGQLTAIAQAHPGVSIGSYPRTGDEPYKVLLTLESTSTEALANCVRALVDAGLGQQHPFGAP